MKNKKSKPKHVSDEELIRLLDEGIIKVDLETTELWVNGNKIAPYLNGADNRGGQEDHKRWSFGLRIDGRRRTITRSKMVYLAGSRKLIPLGNEIHHKDEDNENDKWSNLISVSFEDHKKFHYEDQDTESDGEVPF